MIEAAHQFRLDEIVSGELRRGDVTTNEEWEGKQL